MSGTFLAHARRHQAVRRHPRAPRAQHGGQQAGDRQGLLRRQRRAVRLSAASRLSSATSSRSRRCRTSVKELFNYNPGEGEEAAGRSRLPEGLHASRCRSAPAAPDHMDLLPLVAAYLEQVGVKIEIQPMEYGAFLSAMTTQDQCARLLHEQRPHQPDDHASARASSPGPELEPVAVVRSGATTRRCDAVYRERDEAKRQAHAAGDDARDPRQGALHLAADALHLHGLVAVGEELRRRAARRRRASRPDLCAHLDRPGDEEEDGLSERGQVAR